MCVCLARSPKGSLYPAKTYVSAADSLTCCSPPPPLFIRFGEGLALPEQQWLVYEINTYLTQERGEEVRMDLEPPQETPKV
jgi:hypothetical protein